jgi:hypothetical protein
MSALTIPPLLQTLSIPELATFIFRLLFSAGSHRVYRVPAFSSRSAQLLRVSKLTHALAAPALYAMTEFVYEYDCIGAWEGGSAYLPARRYRQWIRCLKVDDPMVMAARIGDYTGLRRLTVEVPLFLKSQAGAEAMIELRQSWALRKLLKVVGGRVALEVVVEGEVYEVRNELYFTVRRRIVIKKAGEVTAADGQGASVRSEAVRVPEQKC